MQLNQEMPNFSYHIYLHFYNNRRIQRTHVSSMPNIHDDFLVLNMLLAFNNSRIIGFIESAHIIEISIDSTRLG